MQFQIPIDLKILPEPIGYKDKILLVGSCFTEHIGNALQDLKFQIFQNPNGILFGPDAVCKSLNSYVDNKSYTESDFFYQNETWHSWNHHSRFSSIHLKEAMQIINSSQEQANHFLKNADWIIVTLGSSFSYRLTQYADRAGSELHEGVANCHRAPSNWFDKTLLEIDEIVDLLSETYKKLIGFNSKLKFIFTISPVRHIRDGVVENNRSKARLIEAVHHIVNKYDAVNYFPAYELVIDVLRDYRFYDIDLVHPNYPATDFVLEKFTENCIDKNSQLLMQELKKIVIARKHKAFQPQTKAHQQFLNNQFLKAQELQTKFPFLDLREELVYFSKI